MPEHREPSHPPSDPHPALARGSGAAFAFDERPMRAQLAGALLLGIVLVASGLYLWRRPHAPPDAGDPAAGESSSAEAPVLPPDEAGIVSGAVDAGPPSRVRLSDPRVLGCMDKGPKKTPVDRCDHLPAIEQALSRAIEQSATCVPSTAGGAGTIEYVADVSFSRHKLRILLPRAGRSFTDRKLVSGCAAAVRSAVQGVALDGVDHTHARYKISLTATYTGKS
jgi:hypothetical protein